MATVREQIIAAIAARLAAIPFVAEVEVMPTADPISFPAFAIFDNGQDPAEYEAEITRQNFAPSIECYVEREGGAAAYAEINALYAATVRTLIDGTDLDGLVETIDEGRLDMRPAPLASATRLYFALDLPITFAARRGDPSQPA